MDTHPKLVPQINSPDTEDDRVWSEGNGERRDMARIPTGSKVIAEPMRGPARCCLVHNVGEGGICLHWPAATVAVNQAVNLVFTRSENGADRKIEHVGVVKWYSPTHVGIVFRESLLAGRKP